MPVLRVFSVLLVSAFAVIVPAHAQGHAAMERMLAHHGAEEVGQMRQDAHYRYHGELLFYSASFLVEENDVERAATEEEIRNIDLHAYDGIRMVDHRTAVQDPLIDKHVILLSRNEFEAIVLQQLSAEDLEAFMASKNAALLPAVSKTR